MIANSRAAAAMRSVARALGRGLAIAVEADAVQLHPVVNEAEAEPLRNPLLERFQLVVDELDHVAGLDVDQMVVVGCGSRFITRPPIAELMALENSRFLEQPN